MLRLCLFMCCAGLAAFMTGCSSSASLPDTRDADVQAVKAVEMAWAKDVAAKDAATFAKYYADDATVLIPNSPAIHGRADIEKALKPMLADPNFALTFASSTVEASKGGDLVYTQGAYTMTTSDAKGKPMTDKGKYLTIFKKQADG